MPDSLGGRTILKRAVVHISDVRSDPTYGYGPRVIQDAGWRTGLGVPLLREGAAIGLLGMWRREVRRFDRWGGKATIGAHDPPLPTPRNHDPQARSR